MDFSTRIKAAATVAGLSLTDLARALNMSPQNLSARLKTDRWSSAERAQIAQALGAVYVECFKFPDGTRI